MKKRKLRIDRILVAIAGVLIVTGIICCLFVFHPNDNSSGPQATVESNIDRYDYVLTSNQTSLYKSFFKELETVLNQEKVDEEAYVTLLTKLFIADFYNLDNKWTNTDVGGVQFVYSTMQDNFVLNATNTLYLYVESNLYGERTQKLPKVKEITDVTVTQDTYTYNDQTDPNAYVVNATWSYEEDLGYDTTKTFIFVHEDTKLSLVEIR